MYFTATYLHRTFAFNAVLPPFETLEQPVALAVSVLTCRTSGVRTAYIYIYIYRNTKWSVYCQYRQHSLTFRALAFRQKEIGFSLAKGQCSKR